MQKTPKQFVVTWKERLFTLSTMVREKWQFDAPPFAGSLEPTTFYEGVPQEEALARLEWLLEHKQRCGLVAGDHGIGKSHLAAVVKRRLAGCGAETTLLSLRGIQQGDWLDLLLSRMPLDAASRAEPIRSWQKLENHFRENTLMERPSVIILDDFDQAPEDCLQGIARIVSAAEPLFAQTMVVALAAPEGISRIPDTFQHRTTVKIELVPWEEADVARFITFAIQRVGGRPELFSNEAIGTISRFAKGVPRQICQLAHLCTVVATSEQHEQVDSTMVEGVWRELTPIMADQRPPEYDISSNTPPPPKHPQVRSVRKLWE